MSAIKASFKNPLKKPRTDFSFKSGVFDSAAIGKVLRDRLGGNWPGIVPDPPLLPVSICSRCKREYDPNTGESKGQCNGACSY